MAWERMREPLSAFRVRYDMYTVADRQILLVSLGKEYREIQRVIS